jgi:tRNA dimethylallyltransferase
MMIRDGLLSEIRSLMDDGLGPVLQNKKIVGYCEIIDAYEGRDSFENAVLLVKQHSRNYGKRQLTWFRNKAQVHWINPEEDKYLDNIKSRLGKFLGKIS